MQLCSLVTRRVMLGGAIATSFVAATALMAQAKRLTLATTFYTGSLSRKAADDFARLSATGSAGGLEIEVGGASSHREAFEKVAAGQAQLAHFYAPALDRPEPILRLSALPMLASSFDEAEKLLRIARPYYEAALARHGQILLVAQPWRPGALWSKRAIGDGAEIKGASFATGSAATQEGWGAILERLGARNSSPTTAEVILSSGYTGNTGNYGKAFPFFAEIFVAAQLNFLTANRSTLEALPALQRDALIRAGKETEAGEWKANRDLLTKDYADMKELGVSVTTTPPEALMKALRSSADADLQAWEKAMGSDGTALLTEYRKAIGRS